MQIKDVYALKMLVMILRVIFVASYWLKDVQLRKKILKIERMLGPKLTDIELEMKLFA